jgi:hypothetical protein
VAGGVWFLPVRRLAMTLCLTDPIGKQGKSVGHERKNKRGGWTKNNQASDRHKKIFGRHQTYSFFLPSTFI